MGVKSNVTELPHKIASIDEIFGAHDLRIEPVSVPEWGGMAYVRELNGDQLAWFATHGQLAEGGENMTLSVDVVAKIVAMCLCDSDGNYIGAQPGDDNFTEVADKLRKKSAAPLQRCFYAVLTASELTKTALEDKEKK